MTKVFISYSSKDQKFVAQLSERLEKDGIHVWTWDNKMAIGDSINDKINKNLNSADFFIVVLSKSSVSSQAVNFELSATIINEISRERNIILPLLIEDCEIPFSLQDRFFLDFRYSFDDNYDKLLKALKAQNTRKLQATDRQSDRFQSGSYEFQLKSLQQAYSSGNLTLFCGAGISYEAGIPTWNALLKSLLKEVYSDNKDIPDIDIRLANLFQRRINVSPLILAQYLKTLLGKKFTSTVRDTLYKNCNDKSKVVDAITELSRPKRDGKPLRAVITFNFDDLIEESLAKEKVDFKCIFSEGERFSDKQIPIYHPHGCLPRKKTLTAKNEVVFSEDAYHSQFIDPFSWSNLVQLNHLNNCTCLFTGISLTDPNMRRLLDVQMRKNGKDERNHYIIKKRYTFEDLYPESVDVKVKDKKVIPVLESIEEQDANYLGFNVIWINDFKEIPEILFEIGKSH